MKRHTVDRRAFSHAWLKSLGLLLLITVGVAEIPASSAEGTGRLRIVEQGRPTALIVLPSEASEQVRRAAEVLQFFIRESTNAILPIVKSGSGAAIQGDMVRLWIGRTGQNKEVQVSNLDDDGFKIAFRDKSDVAIVGPTDWGTEFGVYEFLERYVGIRWLMPGQYCVFVPRRDTLDIEVGNLRETPALISRQLSGLKGPLQWEWARRNRMHGRLAFHHNLVKIFPPEKYRVTNPEFFPVIGGQRYFPPPDRPWDWQPCLSAPGIVDEAAKNIIAYFSAHPEEQSFSLGMNDSSKWCECERCRPRKEAKKNYRGQWDDSDVYFRWANAVVEKVSKVHKNKVFGFLAGSRLAEPPSSVDLHPRLVPMITYDRLKWVDPSIEKTLKQVHEAWASKCNTLGWYDYMYGSPYCVPRVYFHKMAEYIRHGVDHGVRAIYAEAYPNWGEGPKLYLALKLMWNPDQDVDELLHDWYVSAVGTEAAKDLAAYYALWEDFWTERVPKSDWFGNSKDKSAYLAFHFPEYMDLLTYEDVILSRNLLESVVSKTVTEDQKKRASMILRAFEYYEASVISYLGLVKKKPWAGKNDDFFEEMNEKRLRLVNEFENDPVLIHPVRFDKPQYKHLRW